MKLHNFLTSADQVAHAKRPRAWFVVAREFLSLHQSLDVDALLSALGTGAGGTTPVRENAPHLNHVGLTLFMTPDELAVEPHTEWAQDEAGATFSRYPSVLLKGAFEATGNCAPPISVFKSAPPLGCEVLVIETPGPSGDVSLDREHASWLRRIAGPALHFAFEVNDERTHDEQAQMLLARGLAPRATLKAHNESEGLISSYFDGASDSHSFRIELCYAAPRSYIDLTES